jgi:hypothetical protein
MYCIAVHRRLSRIVGVPQNGSGISRFFRQDRVERVRRDEDVAANVGVCHLPKVSICEQLNHGRQP